jgi:CRP-like cAMP-binding protein
MPEQRPSPPPSVHPDPELTSATALWTPLEASSQATRARLMAVARPLSLPAGAALLTVGGAAEGVSLLVQGVVRIFHALAPDCQFTMKLRRAPHALGVMEVMRQERWVASVEALTLVEGLHLPANAIREALAMDHGFTTAVLNDVLTQFGGSVRASRALAFEGCERRLIRVLLEYAEHFGRPGEEGIVIRYPLSRQRMALEIGAARRSVDRALATLTAEKLLSLSPRGWHVLHEPDTLRARLNLRGGASAHAG